MFVVSDSGNLGESNSVEYRTVPSGCGVFLGERVWCRWK